MTNELGTYQGITELFKDRSGQRCAIAIGPPRFHQSGKPDNVALPRRGCV